MGAPFSVFLEGYPLLGVFLQIAESYRGSNFYSRGESDLQD